MILLVACARPAPVTGPPRSQAPPPQALSWYLRGALLREEGALPAAEAAFGEAAFFDLQGAGPLVAQAQAALAQGAPGRALPLAEEAHQRAPLDRSASAVLARCLLGSGRPAAAIGPARDSGDPALLVDALLGDGQRAAACAAAMDWSRRPPQGRDEVFSRRAARQRACDPPAG